MDKILAASYGDHQQRKANKAGNPTSQEARKVLAAFKERKILNPAQPDPDRVEAKGYRPPFWDSKKYGEPYGEFNRQPPKVVAVHDPAALGNKRPGVKPTPPQPKLVVARPSDAPYVQPDPDVPGKHMSELEARMRKQVRARLALHITERDILLRAFKHALGLTGQQQVTPQTRATPDQFMAFWASFGVAVARPEAVAIFNKYGQDYKGNMPCLVYIDAFLAGASRFLAKSDEVQQGAFEAGRPAVHRGPIKYPECRKTVYPPTNWDPAAAERSASLPEVELRLEFVHGYEGQRATSANMFYDAAGRVIYHVAALGVVYDRMTHTQAFFGGHNDDVTSLCLHPNRRVVATGQLGASPYVCIWDSTSLQELARLDHGEGARSITACGFSPDGTTLATVSTDNTHTLRLWDWVRDVKRPVDENKTAQGTPPATYGVLWSPFEPRMVTYGMNTIKFWKMKKNQNGVWIIDGNGDAGRFNKSGTHTVTSAAFLPSGITITGSISGELCSWQGSGLVAAFQAHGKGPEVARFDGPLGFHGVRGLVLKSNKRTLLSAGADGFVRAFDVSSGQLGPEVWKLPIVTAAQWGSVTPPLITSLDISPTLADTFIAGTHRGDIWEIDKDPEILIHGHPKDLYALAPFPDPSRRGADAAYFATSCESDEVFIWDAEKRGLVMSVHMGKGLKARSLAVSHDGRLIAVGFNNGGLKVLERTGKGLDQVYWAKHCGTSIDELKFSPDGAYLAVGSHDQVVDVYDIKKGFVKLSRCVGHSSTVTHIDWAADSSVLMSNCQAYELLHFDPKTGKQVKQSQRDTRWATWTGILGFDVMGIWHKDSDGTDINSVDRSPSGKYLVSADDLGGVNLFNYPCVVRMAPRRTFHGHSSHVMNVRWTADEKRVLSVGGKDRAVFQWRVVPVKAEANEYRIRAPFSGDEPETAAPPPQQQQQQQRGRGYPPAAPAPQNQQHGQRNHPQQQQQQQYQQQAPQRGPRDPPGPSPGAGQERPASGGAARGAQHQQHQGWGPGLVARPGPQAPISAWAGGAQQQQSPAAPRVRGQTPPPGMPPPGKVTNWGR